MTTPPDHEPAGGRFGDEPLRHEADYAVAPDPTPADRTPATPDDAYALRRSDAPAPDAGSAASAASATAPEPESPTKPVQPDTEVPTKPVQPDTESPTRPGAESPTEPAPTAGPAAGPGLAAGPGRAAGPGLAPTLDAAADTDATGAGDGGTPPPFAAAEPPPFAAPEPPPFTAAGPPPFTAAGPPPGAAWPPPFAAETPPMTAFAARHGLVRPASGRYLAGVCAAIGRATNTDPVLWRVLLVVLSLFGGVGLLVYLVGWLFIPAEGDTASPIEALFGRGRSSTSTPAIIALGIGAIIVFGAVTSTSTRILLILGVVVTALVLARTRAANRQAKASGPPPSPLFPPPPVPGPVGAPPPPAATLLDPPAGAYRPPFAPGGPYASSSPYAGASPYAASLGYPADAPPYPGLVPPPPVPVKPPRPKSRLGGVVVSLACVALGILALVDISGGAVSGGAYVATALAVVGLGLVVGAWMGRARWLILPGVLLTLALIGNSVAGSGPWPNPMRPGSTGNLTWSPTTPDSVDRNYRLDAGNGTLDLSHVDFTDRTVDVNAAVDLGNLVVILPPKVDVTVDAKVDVGDADVLGQRWGGLDKSSRRITDEGSDGPGGGHLNLTTSVDVGKLEVHR